MALLGGLIHNFTITETRRLHKFTVYRVLMISFPRNSSLFSSGVKLTVWKRYSDFKRLEANLSKIYKHYNLKSFFKADNAFFKRFDPAVIEQRKQNILEFLYYCSEHPVLYKSQCFVKFFAEDNSSPTEADDEVGTISSLEDATSFDLSSTNNSIDEEGAHESKQEVPPDEISFDPLGTGFDYLYDAAMCFSQAVQEEANLRFKPAFELYKVGIDKLLTGAKSDNNDKRKRIAKAKAGKYLERAEMLFESHLMQLHEETFVFEDPLVDDQPSVLALERPVNNLSRFKVIGVNDYKMRVQDCADKKCYFLKNVYKDSTCTISLPQAIPFMIKLISFYKTDNSIFLLLPLISGGLLWDYISNYTNKTETNHLSIEELFVEPPSEVDVVKAQESDLNEPSLQALDIEVAEESFQAEETDQVFAFELQQPSIPSFETLSSEMDVNDLMSCSQKLLRSVSKTLEKSQVKAKENLPIMNSTKTEDLSPATETPELPAAPFEQPRITNIPIEVSPLPGTVLKQWSSELIVAVNNLHRAGVICGDLNLNNLLLGPKGHLTLTYFYQNDRIDHQQLCRLNPKAVKCLYVAFDFPLTKSSDWYSVGVLIYEIVTRERFYLNHPAGISRFNEIQYSNPDDLSEDVKDLLHGLIIDKNRYHYDDLVIHPYFKNIVWEEVQRSGLDLFKV